MTTPQHCDHEFVCRFYVDNGPCIQPDILSSVCEHDSRRSRPAPSTDCVKCLEEDRVTMLDLDAAIAAQARKDENKHIVKILEDYRFALDYPDCPPGDVIKKLVESLRNGGKPR